MIINVSRLFDIYRSKHGGNSYSRVKIRSLLNGNRGGASKKEIQQLRQILKNELSDTDKKLAHLENE